MSSVSCFHIAIYPMRKRVSISTSSGVVARMTETVPETTTFYASFFGTTDFSVKRGRKDGETGPVFDCI
jgi:hypothetical protein